MVFYHISPLIGNPFRSLLGCFWSEHHKTLIFLDHIIYCWPISTIFWHSRNRKPVFPQASSVKHLSQALWWCNIVFNENGDDLRRVCLEKSLDLFENIDGRLLVNQVSDNYVFKKIISNIKGNGLIMWFPYTNSCHLQKMYSCSTGHRRSDITRCHCWNHTYQASTL